MNISHIVIFNVYSLKTELKTATIEKFIIFRS
mgnify:CR=1 FL=1